MGKHRDIALIGAGEAANRVSNLTGNGATGHNFHRNWVSGPISGLSAKQVVNRSWRKLAQ
jgi:hypothetical protein